MIPPQILRNSRNLFLTASLGGLAIGVANAQFTEVVASDDFNTYTNTGFVLDSNGTTSLVADGGGGNALQYTATTGSGFFASGYDWVPVIQPGPGGPNISTAPTDYQVSFKLTINSAYIPANGMEFWISYGTMDFGGGEAIPNDGSNLYPLSLAGFTTGVTQTVTFTLDANHFTPGQYGDPFVPTVDQLRVRLNALDFNATAGQACTFTVDDFTFKTVTAGSADGDSLPDVWEANYYSPITDYGDHDDPDGDTFDNLAEYNGGSNPLLTESVPGDIDGDGLMDDYEDQYFGNNNGVVEPSDLGQTPDGDFDDDFASNIDEQTAGSLPNNSSSWPDTDGDEMNDGYELAYGLDVHVDDSGVDNDSDGFTNLQEHNAGTAPNDAAWTPAKALLKHRWSFNGNLDDSEGGATAQIIDPNSDPLTGGVATQNATSVTLGGGGKGESAYILLGNNLLSALHANGPVPVTIELWATPQGARNWSRIFDFGTDNGGPGSNQSLMMSWTQGVDLNSDQVLWQGKGTSNGTNAPYALNTPYHIVMTIIPSAFSGGAIASGAQVVWYSSTAASSQLGGQKGSFNVANSNLDDLVDTVCYLGRSMYNDDTAQATYDEVRIWDGALTQTERELFQGLGPNNLTGTVGPVDYHSWAVSVGLTPNVNDGAGQNPDNDPYANILEYQLGGNPLAFDGHLLTSTDNGTSLLFTFQRSDISETDSTLNFRWSTNLATWNVVPIGATSSPANGNGVIVTVTEDGGTTPQYDLIKVEVPKTNAVGGKLFGQLQGKSQP